MVEDRQSKAFDAELVTDPDEKARLESRNALRQFDLVVRAVEYWTAPEGPRPFRLRASAIMDLNRAALEGLSGLAGCYRPAGIEIQGSHHTPPEAFLVPGLVEEFCDYINDNFNRSAIHLASFAMWRMNWIHPFVDGNGRTSRALSYLILCVRIGSRIPGTRTIPDLISSDKDPYYAALEAGDSGDLAPMQTLMEELLASQLVGVIDAAGSERTEGEVPSV
jgi:Fic family protein